MFILLASIFVLFFIFGFVGAIYPTKLHKRMKLGNRLRNVALFFVSFIAFFVVVINSPDPEAQSRPAQPVKPSAQEPIKDPTKSEEATKDVTKSAETIKVEDWEGEIKKIAASDKTKTEKFDEVSILSKNYRPDENELADFESHIVREFISGRYLKTPEDDLYMLTNIFKADVVNRQYHDKYQVPIDEFAFDFWQNTKYVYRGVDDVDSQAVKANERQMKKALKKMGRTT
ncbi:hypothetical protein [Thermoactinomyces sp. CICC 23799]|uniref:hypothetical protein n=1 Tax=Thermoactinomyces sp. CICC 23799 TaxID=2767429 RepID=UPI0018DBFA22|nr:hypothetical protein [Thermoactinomyces sp. CICC 23799]MBH8600509.1 hypothetical protein [Thermoactinomyces sp. CICC 23799]